MADNVIQVLEGLGASANQPCFGCPPQVKRDAMLRGLGAPPAPEVNYFAIAFAFCAVAFLLHRGQRRSRRASLGGLAGPRAMGAAVLR